MRALILALALVVGCGGEGPAVQPPPPMVFAIQDDCADGRGFQVRFFDSDGSEWPAGGQVYAQLTDAMRLDVPLDCAAGTSVCYGAEPAPTDGRFWGKSLAGDKPCDACCVTCGNQATGFLSCP